MKDVAVFIGRINRTHVIRFDRSPPLDEPGHGDRPRNAEDKQWVAAVHHGRAAGEPIDPIVVDYNTSLTDRGVDAGMPR
jgi:hypothetical protein